MNYSVTLLVLVSMTTFQFSSGFQSRQDLADAATKAGLKCKKNSKMSDEAMDDVIRRDRMDTHDKKCFMACIMEQMGIIKDNTYDWKSHTDIMQYSYTTEPQNKIFINNCKATGQLNYIFFYKL